MSKVPEALDGIPADAPATHPDAAVRLRALAEHLKVRGFEAETVGNDLLVIAPVNDMGRRLCVLVMCYPRPGDGERLWFWLHGPKPHPIAEADRVIDAAVAIVGALRSAL
ncbi:hypothetical protein D0T12_01585 [Actinomadura spongiicola]|uniref:Uncharacterized protein n=1 Tax=Actinomadura spongiicola TaxID=2303421 RepID=A0A372GNJ5_9ACTN|nr:hypothetical protein [Actinomadura spongiicola]RFS86977.1 hypothetical protein D0T12_01585 [Actinomadura spongiicola]